MSPALTVTIIVCVIAFGILYDIWTVKKHGTATSISWVTWTASRKWPAIAFAAGFLCGHLFWVQQTGMDNPELPHSHSHAENSPTVLDVDAEEDEAVHYWGHYWGQAQPHAVRSGQWPKVRSTHLEKNPLCANCGRSKGIDGRPNQVHHKRPFHLAPDQELDSDNLITLCPRCHFLVGHLDNWKSSNLNVEKDAARQLKEIKTRPKDDESSGVWEWLPLALVYYVFLLGLFYS